MFAQCRRCKVAHDPRRNCRQEDVIAAARAQINVQPVVHVQTPVVNRQVVNKQVVVNKVDRNADRHKTSRADYFREYMKTWRASRKARAS